MDVYKESNIEDKRQTRISTLDFIDERLDSIRHELGLVERDVTEFITKNKALQLEKQSELYLEKLNNESTELVQQELRLSIINWLIRYLESNSWKAVPVQLGTQEPSLEPLIGEYNQLQLERQNALYTMPATNPYIQQNLDPKINKLRNDIQQALENVRESYTIARNSIQKQNQEIEGKLQSIPSKGRELAERQRQQKIKEELYLFLLQKREESAIASASTISDSKIVEPALSSYRPIRPNGRSTYMLAIMIGLALPAGLVMLKEYLNDRVNSRQDIERETDAPFIGEIGHSENAGALVVTQNSRRFISEQFRIIRTNLQFILNKIENPVILVTSSFSGEGKSFVSTNMGAVMALTGKRTVIVELDIRKPKIIANLELKRQAGVTNYIVGKVRLEDIIMPVPNIENLFVVPCGPVPPNPAEMLLDPKLKDLFQKLKDEFDIVIVDTAPVGLVSDAMVIGGQADCTLYILRQGYTYKKQLGLINEMYTQHKLPRLSLLLNDVKTGVGYGSYYGYSGYGYGYGYGYGAGYFDEDGKKRKNGVLRKIRRAIKL
jgi:capsular exopolysaccharide synthesis family protein